MHNTSCSINIGKLKKKWKHELNETAQYESSSITIEIWNHKLKIVILKNKFHKRNSQEVLLQ